MRCISLWQPWATLWVRGIKIYETRHWPTNVRGETAIHAAKRKSRQERDFTHCDFINRLLGGDTYDSLPFGCIVGKVDIVNCLPTEWVYPDHDKYQHLSIPGPSPEVPVDWYLGNYSPGRFGWKGSRFLELERPIPFTGSQGFFEIPDFEELQAALLGRLAL